MDQIVDNVAKDLTHIDVFTKRYMLLIIWNLCDYLKLLGEYGNSRSKDFLTAMSMFCLDTYASIIDAFTWYALFFVL